MFYILNNHMVMPILANPVNQTLYKWKALHLFRIWTMMDSNQKIYSQQINQSGISTKTNSHWITLELKTKDLQ